MKTIFKVLASTSFSILMIDVAWASFDKEYKELNKKARVRCGFYQEDPSLKRVGNEVIFGSHIKSSFVYGRENFEVKVLNYKNDSGWVKKERSRVELSVKDEIIYGEVSRKNFIKFNLRKLNTNQLQIAQKLNLYSMNCAMEIAVEKRYKISNSRAHINVHPHTTYDAFDRSTEIVNKFFSKYSSDQIILLDDYNRKAERTNITKFIKGGMEFGHKELQSSNNLNFPKRSTSLVSPAGHNNYEFSLPELTLDYTGGNHNYCMWNNTRRVLDAFFRGENNKVLNINYHTEGIVVQPGGIIDGLSVPKKIYNRSNLLKDVFDMMSDGDAVKYHSSYLNYFARDYLVPKKHLFSKLLIQYKSEHLTKTLEITGRGKKSYKLNLKYL